MKPTDITHVYVLALERDAKRTQDFFSSLPVGFPLPYPEIEYGYDGRIMHLPEAWKRHPGFYGSLQSHRMLMEWTRSRNETALVLEDDACFCAEFSAKLLQFLENVPDDWQAVMLGGTNGSNPLFGRDSVPTHLTRRTRVNEFVDRVVGYSRGLAYVVRGEFRLQLLRHAAEGKTNWGHMITLPQAQLPCYAPRETLISQRSAHSHTLNHQVPAR